jgi:hypothetical protein
LAQSCLCPRSSQDSPQAYRSQPHRNQPSSKATSVGEVVYNTWSVSSSHKWHTNSMEQRPWEANSHSAQSVNFLMFMVPKVIAVFTRTRHWSLTWARRIQSTASENFINYFESLTSRLICWDSSWVSSVSRGKCQKSKFIFKEVMIASFPILTHLSLIIIALSHSIMMAYATERTSLNNLRINKKQCQISTSLFVYWFIRHWYSTVWSRSSSK